jgi:lysosomal acid phosphatase
MVSKVLGVLILARSGDRSEFLQDPYSYAPSFTESTPLGAVRWAISSSSTMHADVSR